ncbi:MAG: hypothetical protein ACI8XX_001863 [Polaribacter sp.]|jgi:hypothetical protein
MNVSSANVSPIVRLPTANDDQRQTFDRGNAGAKDDFIDSRRTRQESTEYVFRGDVLESVENDKRYKPQFNQEIDPQNREAIANYQATSVTQTDSESIGKLIDRFI